MTETSLNRPDAEAIENMKAISILWGENPSAEDERTYYFETDAELAAFRKGIQAAQGWFDYEIIYTDEEL